jgi:hypothetical protein
MEQKLKEKDAEIKRTKEQAEMLQMTRSRQSSVIKYFFQTTFHKLTIM